jgi:hypothetical protein
MIAPAVVLLPRLCATDASIAPTPIPLVAEADPELRSKSDPESFIGVTAESAEGRFQIDSADICPLQFDYGEN